MVPSKNALFRLLPSIDEMLRFPALLESIESDGLLLVTAAAQKVMAQLREEILAGRLDEHKANLAMEGITGAIVRQLRQDVSTTLVPVINATGVVLHTNLGRAPLSESALAAIVAVGRTYSNLEFDIQSGERGKRDTHVAKLFSQLLNRSSQLVVQTIVVNNCAAALMLALNSLAEGGEVVVSRGELVEIGGSFRVPEVMAKSNATLREVGTTNRTRIGDYERAINDKTRLLLRVHRSNFAIVGFTEQPSLEELVALGKKRNVPVLEDLGNGALFDLATIGVKNETGVAESIRAGVDLITYSGDKLLGGPQAGMISGRDELVAKCRSNPMFRALRVDKLTYAALSATLLAYLRSDYDSIPAVRMMKLSAKDIEERAEAVQKVFNLNQDLKISVIAGESLIGGGTAPTATIPTFLLAITSKRFSADELLAQLRANTIPIIARIEEGRVMLDLRTVFLEDDAVLSQALLNISQ